MCFRFQGGGCGNRQCIADRTGYGFCSQLRTGYGYIERIDCSNRQADRMVYGIKGRHTVQLGNIIYDSESDRYHYLLHVVQGYHHRMRFRNPYFSDGHLEQQSCSTIID